MNGKPNPTRNFLMSSISTMLDGIQTPALFVMRSHMGIQQTALIPLIFSGTFYGAGIWLLSVLNVLNERVTILYVALVVVGYLRNCFQARRRRQTRDWSVPAWSYGQSLLMPVIDFLSPRIYRRWGHIPTIAHSLRRMQNDDFIYYIAEPATLLLASPVLWSIGSNLYPYPVLLAFVCIIVRNDAQLSIYLKAAEISDGKLFERAVLTELDGFDAASIGTSIMTEVPPAPRMRFATDRRTVFDRLSPEVQAILVKDRIANRK